MTGRAPSTQRTALKVAVWGTQCARSQLLAALGWLRSSSTRQQAEPYSPATAVRAMTTATLLDLIPMVLTSHYSDRGVQH
ncbi:hypothetical protein BG030_21615 [Pseudomonas putida]|nr:hypothetical protein BG030_21615 [Pseudomonas putida]